MKYDVIVRREGKWWVIEVPTIDQITQARRVDDVEEMARDLIAVTLDVRLSTVELGHVSISVDDLEDLGRRAAHIARLSAEAVELQAEAAHEMRVTAAELVARGVPLRDVGALLGVSHQRIGQLVKA